ncbi:MAG: DUF434 domain-containing protein [Euryarchaeota archaeon]|nr:DUF434 domain-containing protein [Euryarchaeota archaeon]MBV1730571.1 DUF434 domain-containing protein [Methanobacterium sp.]MBU4547417.1 DUF434 domain-containing protein [Euryarchaeota archaeon]MBU4608676.1 DUF434 domain-containing protein [Euryarchaeota archaeon]MBV1755871.1 DUF434 domain-containing protein [Methanobacterium sp.]
MNKLNDARMDLRFLLNRGYRKKIALNFVGNHYLLNKDERNYLSRQIFSNVKSKNRKQKKIKEDDLKGKFVVIDGYNVLITVESIVKYFNKSKNWKNKLVLSDDGFLRDTASVFGNYKPSSVTAYSLDLILNNLKRCNPKKLKFIFDKQVSFSGELANKINQALLKENLSGVAVLSEKVDYDLKREWKKSRAIISTSDGAIIDQVERVIDIPELVCKNWNKVNFENK